MRSGSIPGSSGSPRVLRMFGDPVLHSPCRAVTPEDGSLSRLVEDLYATMYAARGVGLAAGQTGVPLRVFVFDCPDDEDHYHRGHLINPRLVETGGPCVRGPEGCLSLPGLEAATPRWDHAVVEGEDLAGQRLRITGTGFFARCLQHECDHLGGEVFTDRLSGLRRRRVLRAARRASWWREATTPAGRTAQGLSGPAPGSGPAAPDEGATASEGASEIRAAGPVPGDGQPSPQQVGEVPHQLLAGE